MCHCYYIFEIFFEIPSIIRTFASVVNMISFIRIDVSVSLKKIYQKIFRKVFIIEKVIEESLIYPFSQYTCVHGISFIDGFIFMFTNIKAIWLTIN